MAEILYLQCVVCNRVYGESDVEYTCPACGEAGTLDVVYDYEALKYQLDRDALRASSLMNIWRYRDLLPLAAEGPLPPLAVGWSPVYQSAALATVLGVRDAWVKDDGRNPTGSLKDRASSHVVARAMQRGIRTVATASTGNAAAALAGCIAAVPGMHAVIFVPASAPEAKIAQLLIYGATVLLIDASYDVCFDLSMQVCAEEGWYSRNTGVNPYTTEGKKTVSLEIAEQFFWSPPDVIVVSVGDGSIISGVYKGFYDLVRLGWIERIPHIIGVQAEGSSPLVHAWENHLDGTAMRPVDAHTLADSISAGLPRDRVKALRAVRASGGAYVAVSDESILAAIPELAQLTGVFAEPASSAAFAGARKAVQSSLIHPDESVLLLLTGNGLKDIRRAQQATRGGIHLPPDLDQIRQALHRMENR